jgi:hypothetical protein
MSKRLKLTPRISYLLGIYACNKGGQALQVITGINGIAEKFAKLSVEDLEIPPNNMLSEKMDRKERVFFYNSKIRKLFDRALERKEHLFKYKNPYSANYFAALFDCNGGRDRKSLYIRAMDPVDYRLLENLGIHCTQDGGKTRIASAKTFAEFVKGTSVVISNVA